MFDRALDRPISRRARRYLAAAVALLVIAPLVFAEFAIVAHLVVKAW